MSRLNERNLTKAKSNKKLYGMYLLLVLCCMCAFFTLGCTKKDKKDETKNEKENKEVDYSEYEFVGVKWNRDAECDMETLCFLPNGEFRYSCACGNSVNDADVVESYSYDDTSKMFTINCYEEIEDMITEIKLISCDGKKLELDFGGEKRVFHIED